MPSRREGLIELAHAGVHLQQAIEQHTVFGRFAQGVVKRNRLLPGSLIGNARVAAELLDVGVETGLACGALDEGLDAGNGEDGDEKKREPVASLHGNDAGFTAAGGADGVDRRLGPLAGDGAPAEENDEAPAPWWLLWHFGSLA